MKYYVKLKDNHDIQEYMKEKVDALSLETPEERFPFENELIEVYRLGSYDECLKFIKDIKDGELKKEFQIVKINE